MYHYVRDRENSRYPGLKALDSSRFQKQLNYLEKNYTIIGAEDMANFYNHGKPLPEKSCLLTFDDGYIEHYTLVFPELKKRGHRGCFYPAVNAVRGGTVLDVNKIHLLLARVGYENADKLLAELKSRYEKAASKDDALPSYESLYARFYAPGRYDPPEVAFFKKMLQFLLPNELRGEILDELFVSFMDEGEKTLANELYVSEAMLEVMADNGMHIGAHGNRHVWLDKLEPKEQESELKVSLAFLQRLYKAAHFLKSIAYPFGGYNSSLLTLCGENGFTFGLGTVARMAEPNHDMNLLLPRVDANNVPSWEMR